MPKHTSGHQSSSSSQTPPTQKNFLDIHAACPSLLVCGDEPSRMSLLVTFFWTQMNMFSVAQLHEYGLPLPLRRVSITTPQTYVFDSAGPLLVTIRGTDVTIPKNILMDLTGRLPRTFLKAKTRDELTHSTPEVRTLIETCLETMKQQGGGGRGVVVQAGLFLYAVRCLVHLVQTLAGMEAAGRRPIHLFGHSMGAACVSFLYAWLGDLGYDVSCSCMSCPRLCNDAGYDAWFSRHDNARYRHYYTRGDLVVHGLPKTAGLTRHLSMTYYVAPLVKLPIRSRLLSAFIAHVTFQPSRFRRVVKSRTKQRGEGRSPTRERVLVPPCFLRGNTNIVLTSMSSQWAIQ